MPATPYTPAPVSSFTSFEEVSRFLQAELQRISAGISQAESGYQEVFYVAPTKPREGMLAYADGTNWNPGSGAGLYEYVGGAWRRVNPVIPAASETVSGIIELATNAEVQTGTDAARAVTPAGLASLTATDARRGLVELATTAEVNTGTDTEKAITPAALTKAWPIGSVFIAVVSTNPNTLLGYGTWVAFGTGRTLVGIDVGQAEFDVVEETGGAKTHVLTTAELASHSHVERGFDEDGNAVRNLGANTSAGERLNFNSSVTTAVLQKGSADLSTAAEGGGAAHNNLQPYIVVYMWKRTG
ncbi:MAG: phage baseplate protein [Minisyncoccota bacterium]